RQIGVASVAMTVVVLSLLWLWQDWTVWPWWERLIKLAVVVGAGGGAYGALLWLQGIRLRDLRGH
ncbi:murein biosynthesis integral membrane protein MurJ, partial [Lysobacter sp. 2RAB21]